MFKIVFAALLLFASLYAEDRFVQVDGAQIFCETQGEGSPLIVVHGGPGLSHDYLLPGFSRLAENHFVIFYDQRASGRSSGEINADSMRLEVFVDDLESIRKEFRLEKIALLGHSWGALLAMQYAIDHPEAVEKLILCNSLPSSSEDLTLFVDEYFRRIAPYEEELKTLQDDPEKYYRVFFRAYCCNPEKANLLNLQMSQKAFSDCANIENLFNESLFKHSFNLKGQLKQLSIPTLIIHGDTDIVPPAAAEHIHNNIPGSTYILMKDCGHFPYVEMPDQFFDHLSTF